MRSRAGGLLCGLIILLSISGIFLSPGASPGPTVHSGFISDTQETIREMKNTLDGLSRFAATLRSVAATLASIMGLRTIALLIGTLFFSMAASSLGIPRGMPSFIAGLAASDILWFIWARSFHPGSLEFLPDMIRSNSLLLIPAATVFLLVKVAFPRVARMASRIHIFHRGAGRGPLSRKELAELLDEYQTRSLSFQKALLCDLAGGTEESSGPSRETLDSAAGLESTIKKLTPGTEKK